MNRVLATAALLVAGSFATIGASHAQTPAATSAGVVGTAPGSAAAARRVTATATVTAIDLPTRHVTLRGPQGREFVVVAGEDVRNLPQVRVGDEVSVEYLETLTLDLRKGGTGLPARRSDSTSAMRAPTGDRPAGTAAREVTITADVVAVDTAARTVSLRGPEGRVMDLPIADPEQLKLVAVGDQVQATYVEAAALRVTPTAAAPAVPAAAPGASVVMRPRSAWQFRANLYAWLPEVGGKTSVPVAGNGGPSLNVDMGKIFPIKFAFMGNLDVSNGQWGGFTDVVYASFGDSLDNTRDFSMVNGSIPVSTTATLDAHLQGWVWTAAGTYRVVNQPTWTMDVLGGFRLLDIKQTVGWSFDGDIGSLPPSSRSGSRDFKLTNWDAIVGVKGRFAPLGDRAWFVPYYADIGAGDSDLTWQAAIGVGYAFGWGNVTASYRYLDYRMKSGRFIDTVSLSGPMIGVGFHW